MKNAFIHFCLMAALVISAGAAHAQESYPLRTTIQKEKGAFLGYIGSGSVTGLNEVSSLELGVKWVGLLGQPVEDYIFRWTNNGFYLLPNGSTRLNRYQLEAYPDLLARYDNIRPSSLVLSLSVSADPVNGSTQTPHHYSGGGTGFASGTKYVRSTPHMVVLRAGCRSSNLIASSPPNNRDFIDWNRSSYSGDPDQSAQNTLAGAKQVTLSNLRVDSVEWPMSRIQSIYDELQDRTNVPEDTDAASARAELDSFWGSDRPGVNGKRMSESVELDRCPDVEALKVEEDFKIQRAGNPSGYGTYDRVVSDDGDVLIPWVFIKQIFNYENGEALAYEHSEDPHKYTCGSGSWDELHIQPLSVGRLNSSGAWIGSPKRYGVVFYNPCGSSRSQEFIAARGAENGLEVISREAWEALIRPVSPIEEARYR